MGTKKIISYTFACMAVLILAYSAVHNHSFQWGMEEGWNLAVEQCNRNKDNCVPSRSGEEGK